MNPVTIGLIGIICLLILLFMRVWVGAAMAIVGVVGLIAMRGVSQALAVAGSFPFNELNKYSMTAIPMFALMGMIISETNLGRDLYAAAHKTVGSAKGGLASATVVAGGILGAICGSENIATVILTKISYPEMKKLNYSDELSTAAVAAGAPLSIIIPPSMPLILYAILTEQSVGSLFIGGIIPGILLIIAFCIVISIRCSINPALGPRGPKYNVIEQLNALKGIIPVAILFVVVLGSIYFGICTTTEAGGLGVAGAFIIALVTKQLSGKKFVSIMKESVSVLGMVLTMLVGIFIFVGFIALSKVPFWLVDVVGGLDVHRNVILLLIIVMYLILGMLLPQLTIIILTVPILFQVVMSLGFDPIWFGVLVVMMQAMGGITPPVGIVAFMVSGISGVPSFKIFKGLIPLIFAMLVVVFLICAYPSIITWLPSMMH